MAGRAGRPSRQAEQAGQGRWEQPGRRWKRRRVHPPPFLAPADGGLQTGASAAGRGVQCGQSPGIQTAQGRPAGGAHGAEVETRHDPLPSIRCRVSVTSRSCRRTGRRAAGRHSAGPTRVSHSDIRTVHDPRPRDVSLATVTPGEVEIDVRHAILCRLPEVSIKNGLNSTAGHTSETMKALHEWVTVSATVVTFRRFSPTFRTPGQVW